ncbi:hypothetical protein Ahy_A04g019554 [Arachis hypogaea]|uniref:Uncharacterized protein n=1 Tax=Arachis hypogaea TaxID=3818 RepID=A0A445DG42_ARAHY|nr:hypothetical protein Ahy_A04g019554 [Arachis hypogaea]
MPRKPRYTVSTIARTVAVPDSQTYATLPTDGTKDTGANTSSAQRRARAPPPPHSGNKDEDYDLEADEVESFDDHVNDLFAVHEVERQGNANSKKKDTDFWEVDVIENGVTSCMELTVKEALTRPPGRKIVLQHNKVLQQVGQAASLLSGFLGTLVADFQQLPICESS